MPGPEGVPFNPQEFEFKSDQNNENEKRDIELEISKEQENLKKLELLRSEVTAVATID